MVESSIRRAQGHIGSVFSVLCDVRCVEIDRKWLKVKLKKALAVGS